MFLAVCFRTSLLAFGLRGLLYWGPPRLHLCSDMLGSPVISQKLSRQLVPREGTNESKGAKSSQLELSEAGSHHETNYHRGGSPWSRG